MVAKQTIKIRNEIDVDVGKEERDRWLSCSGESFDVCVNLATKTSPFS